MALPRPKTYEVSLYDVSEKDSLHFLQLKLKLAQYGHNITTLYINKNVNFTIRDARELARILLENRTVTKVQFQANNKYQAFILVSYLTAALISRGDKKKTLLRLLSDLQAAQQPMELVARIRDVLSDAKFNHTLKEITIHPSENQAATWRMVPPLATLNHLLTSSNIDPTEQRLACTNYLNQLKYILEEFIKYEAYPTPEKTATGFLVKTTTKIMSVLGDTEVEIAKSYLPISISSILLLASIRKDHDIGITAHMSFAQSLLNATYRKLFFLNDEGERQQLQANFSSLAGQLESKKQEELDENEVKWLLFCLLAALDILTQSLPRATQGELLTTSILARDLIRRAEASLSHHKPSDMEVYLRILLSNAHTIAERWAMMRSDNQYLNWIIITYNLYTKLSPDDQLVRFLSQIRRQFFATPSTTHQLILEQALRIAIKRQYPDKHKIISQIVALLKSHSFLHEIFQRYADRFLIPRYTPDQSLNTDFSIYYPELVSEFMLIINTAKSNRSRNIVKLIHDAFIFFIDDPDPNRLSLLDIYLSKFPDSAELLKLELCGLHQNPVPSLRFFAEKRLINNITLVTPEDDVQKAQTSRLTNDLNAAKKEARRLEKALAAQNKSTTRSKHKRDDGDRDDDSQEMSPPTKRPKMDS